MSELMLTEKDNGKTVVSHPGIAIIIRIEENLTTGYSWEIERLDTQLLELEDTAYETSASGGIAGAGGIRSFTFRAIGTGNCEIGLKLWRRWVGDASIVQRYAVTLQIQN